MKQPFFLYDGEPSADRLLILAHGAGQPMDAPFMESVAREIASSGTVRVARFEFPYMAARRTGGKKRPPDRPQVLESSWRETVEALGHPRDRTYIGGKSLGGRIASMVADDLQVAGLVCLGYPFHTPGRPERTRTGHLEDLRTPALFCQGERDPFGKPAEVATYRLASSIQVHWIGDGDHGLKPRKASGRDEAQNIAEAAARVQRFIEEAR